MALGQVAMAVGLLLLGHASYSTIQYREQLKFSDGAFVRPPIEIVVELVAALLACLVAGVSSFGAFSSISLQADNNRVVELPELVDFMTFNHRRKALPLQLSISAKKR